MKLVSLVLLIFSPCLKADEKKVISIREPIPFSVDMVSEIEEKIEKSQVEVKDKRSVIKFRTNNIKAEVFNPALQFKSSLPKLKASYSQPTVPKVLKD